MKYPGRVSAPPTQHTHTHTRNTHTHARRQSFFYSPHPLLTSIAEPNENRFPNGNVRVKWLTTAIIFFSRTFLRIVRTGIRLHTSNSTCQSTRCPNVEIKITNLPGNFQAIVYFSLSQTKLSDGAAVNRIDIRLRNALQLGFWTIRKRNDKKKSPDYRISKIVQLCRLEIPYNKRVKEFSKCNSATYVPKLIIIFILTREFI